MDISYWGAFLAGVLSFITPCVLPIVPPYLAYIAGLSYQELADADLPSAARRRVFISALLFVTGFTLVFVALGASASLLGQFVAQYARLLAIVAGVLIAIMGLHFLGVLRIGILYRDSRIEVEQSNRPLFSALLMGMAFAFGWTPCVGPVLATVLFVAGAEQTALRGATLLFSYALGMGLPFLLIAVFASRLLPATRRFMQHLHTVEKVVGVLLVLTGLLIASGQMSTIAQWMIDTWPGFTEML